MKKIILYLLLAGITLFTACSLEDPTQPTVGNILPAQLVLTKMVAIGNSLTAGVQSAGLVEDFQLNSFPYLIAQQMGRADQFEQPLIADPGLSNTPGVGVLDFVGGQIVPRGTYTNPLALAKNINLPRPYDNLGLPGANLDDMLRFKLSPNPGIWDLILRNPNFGNTTVLEQARLLNPTLILFWGGNNDVLGAATNGGDPSQITSVSDFQTRYLAVLAELSLL
ncbi:MAG: hypothetical protein EH225_01865, partial [Calditrichaeota bacterium]